MYEMLFALVLSVMLALGGVPAPALAQLVEEMGIAEVGDASATEEAVEEISAADPIATLDAGDEIDGEPTLEDEADTETATEDAKVTDDDLVEEALEEEPSLEVDEFDMHRGPDATDGEVLETEVVTQSVTTSSIESVCNQYGFHTGWYWRSSYNTGSDWTGTYCDRDFTASPSYRTHEYRYRGWGRGLHLGLRQRLLVHLRVRASGEVGPAYRNDTGDRERRARHGWHK